MRLPSLLSKFPFCIAIAALLFLQFSAATSRADTYKIVDLGPDNLQFYGMDDSGHAVFISANCGNPEQQCYVDFLNGTRVGETAVAPTFAWDYTAAYCSSLPPCTISKNGRTAVIASEPTDEDGLFVESGGNPPQLLDIGGFTNTEFAINGLGISFLTKAIYWMNGKKPSTFPPGQSPSRPASSSLAQAQ
jgi:hypothetical protein